MPTVLGFSWADAIEELECLLGSNAGDYDTESFFDYLLDENYIFFEDGYKLQDIDDTELFELASNFLK